MPKKLEKQSKSQSTLSKTVTDATPKIGHRPPKFKTPEDMQVLLDKYFDYCDARKRIEYFNGKNGPVKASVPDPIPYTVEGLLDVLELSRPGLMQYRTKKVFVNTLARAYARIKRNKMERGLSGDYNARVLVFDMTNNHKDEYTDKQDFNVTGDTHNINIWPAGKKVKVEKDQEKTQSITLKPPKSVKE